MKKIRILTIICLVIGNLAIAQKQERQSLFKGLLIGMNTKEVKSEYKLNSVFFLSSIFIYIFSE